MAEEVLSQVDGAHAVTPAQVGQHPGELRLQLLHHLGRPELPAATETRRPTVQLGFVIALLDPPGFAAKFASAGLVQRRRQVFQQGKPMPQADLVSGEGINHRCSRSDGAGDVTDDQGHLVQAPPEQPF